MKKLWIKELLGLTQNEDYSSAKNMLVSDAEYEPN